MPTLNETPTRVVVDPAFNGREANQINAAITIWNAQARNLIQKNFFSHPTSGEIPGYAKNFDPRSCQRERHPDTTLYVVKETNTEHWRSMSLAPEALAVTQRCVTNIASGELLNQVMIINTEKTAKQQFMSVTLHEFGHAIGLNHSCAEEKGKTDYRACETLGADHPYRVALMYPKIHDSKPVTAPQANDIERASCLYEDQ
jgi:hypothetical protein